MNFKEFMPKKEAEEHIDALYKVHPPALSVLRDSVRGGNVTPVRHDHKAHLALLDRDLVDGNGFPTRKGKALHNYLNT